MEHKPGSGPSAHKIEGPSGGGSTSVSDTDSGASQDSNTITEQVDGSRGTDDSNRGIEVSGLQTTGAKEDADSKDEYTSGQARPSLVAVSTGKDDIQQTSGDWTFVNHEKSDAGTVEKVDVCKQIGKADADSVGRDEVDVCKQIAKNTESKTLRIKVHTKEKSLKNDLDVAKVGGTDTTDANEVDAQVRIEGSLEAPRASSQGSPVTVALAGLVDSRPQGAQMLCNSRSVKETRNLPKQPCSFRTRSLSHKLDDIKSLTEMVVHSNLERETNTGGVIPSTGIVSGSQEEPKPNSEAPSTALTAEAQVEADMSQGDPSSVSASGAQEEISEASKAPSTVVLDSGPQEEAGPCAELARTVSTSKSRKEALTSPKAVSKVSDSGAQEKSNEVAEPPSVVVLDSGTPEAVLCPERSRTASRSGSRKEVVTSPEAAGIMSGSEAEGGSSVTLEAPCPVPASGAECVVSDSVVQEDVPSLSEVLSTSEVKGGGVETDVLPTVSSCEAPKDVDTMSSDSPNTVRTTEEVRNSSSTDSAVRNEVGICADPPSRVCEGDVSGVSEAPSTVTALEEQKSFGTNPEENVPRAEVPSKAPESLRRTVSQAGEENLRKPLQMSAQQSETTVSDVPESLPRPVSAGGEPSIPKGDAAGSDSLLAMQAFRYEELLVKKDKELDQKDLEIRKLKKSLSTTEMRLRHKMGHLEALEQNYEGQVRTIAELRKKIQELETDKYRIETEWTKQQKFVNRSIRDLRGQLEQMKKERDTLQDQLSGYEQQHANEQSRGGSYLDDTKAATPALLVSSLNGVKDASNNFVKVLKSSIEPGFEPDELREHIGAVSRNGHVKFQYQAYVCRVLFDGFESPYTGLSKAISPTTFFQQYQRHDLKKSDTVDLLLSYDSRIDPSLPYFCFDKFLKLMGGVQHLLIDKSVDLRQLVQAKQHPRESKLYVSFCKLAVSVWLLQRLAFSFLHPAKLFIAQRGAPFDLNRMQSVVPLDEPSDEEVQLRVGFYVLPGFDVGNSAIPCEVYVAK